MNARVEGPRERIVRSEAVVPATMSAAERDALADALLAVYAEIFAGATREFIVEGMVAPKSEFTTILLHRNAEDRIVGYFAIHFFERHFRGVPTIVVRSSVGMLRAYRGRNANIRWALGVLLKQRLRHPGKPMYGMGPMVHPSSYLQVARYVDVFWPRPDEPVPPDMLGFIVELADEFKMRQIDPSRPLLRAGSMPTRESDAERDYWRRCDKPAARFFVAMNPAYSQGDGIVTMFPITGSMLRGIASRIVRERAGRLVEGTLAAAQRLPLVERLLRPRAVRRQLQAAPLLAGLADGDLRRLAERATIVALPAGHTLFHAGDAGDEVYVVARGAVAVVAGEEMLDQLGAGALFGEIAVLTGGRRKASVRAVIPTTLVKIPGEAVRAVMRRGPLGDALGEMAAARLFDDHLRASGRHRQLGREARMTWARSGRLAELEPGARLRGTDAAFSIVLRGDVLIEQDGAQLSAQAPVVIAWTPSTVVVASTPARVLHVPASGEVAEAS